MLEVDIRYHSKAMNLCGAGAMVSGAYFCQFVLLCFVYVSHIIPVGLCGCSCYCFQCTCKVWDNSCLQACRTWTELVCPFLHASCIYADRADVVNHVLNVCDMMPVCKMHCCCMCVCMLRCNLRLYEQRNFEQICLAPYW